MRQMSHADQLLIPLAEEENDQEMTAIIDELFAEWSGV
jgi:hypothetical protein